MYSSELVDDHHSASDQRRQLTIIVPGDVLIAMGEEQDLEKLEQACNGGAG